jgi:hypothetical protein
MCTYGLVHGYLIGGITTPKYSHTLDEVLGISAQDLEALLVGGMSHTTENLY